MSGIPGTNWIFKRELTLVLISIRFSILFSFSSVLAFSLSRKKSFKNLLCGPTPPPHVTLGQGTQQEKFWSLMFVRETGSVKYLEQGCCEPGVSGSRKPVLIWSSRTVIPSPFGVSAECGHLLGFVVWRLPSRELFQINGFKKVTYLNVDGLRFQESELNFLLWLEAFCVVPAVAGDIGDPRSIAKATLGSLGLHTGGGSRPSRLKVRGGPGNEQEAVCGPQSIWVAFLDAIRSIRSIGRSRGQILQLSCRFALWFLWRAPVLPWKVRKERPELRYPMFFPL